MATLADHLALSVLASGVDAFYLSGRGAVDPGLLERLGELGRQLTYKAAWYGTELVLVERFYPSSKTCSRCGSVKEQLSLSPRVYACEHCGLELDRDVNAAINLARWPDARAATASPKTAAA